MEQQRLLQGIIGTKCLNYKEGSKPRVREKGILPQDELLPFQEVGNHECGRR